ncbi:MAG TPA: hypothetical protein ACFYD2_07630, partial [Candidatus Avalokitesvara rifleensis]
NLWCSVRVYLARLTCQTSWHATRDRFVPQAYLPLAEISHLLGEPVRGQPQGLSLPYTTNLVFVGAGLVPALNLAAER